MITPLADAASAWTFFGGLAVAVGTVVVFLGFLIPSELKWSENASTLGALAIGLGTVIAFVPLFSEYNEHHKALAFAGGGVAVFLMILLCVSAWRSSHRGQEQHSRRRQEKQHSRSELRFLAVCNQLKKLRL
jgi:uncharacterized membrane protein